MEALAETLAAGNGVASAVRRVKVLRVLPMLDFGGVESRVVLQSRLHNRARFDLGVVAFHRLGAAAAAIRQSGVSVDEVGVNPAVRNPLATLALARYLKGVRPDIAHASISEANAHCLVAARLAGVPIVIAEEVGQPEHTRLSKFAFKILYRLANAVVGVTQTTCDYMVREDGAPPDRVTLVYNCAGPTFFPESPRAPRVRCDGEPFRVLLVGRLVPVKNHATFISAFAAFAQKHQDVELWIAGSGELQAETERQIKSLGLEGKARMLGFRSDVLELFQSVHLFALPSWSEGCSVGLIEAMATGIPVLASRVPGNLEVMGQLGEDWAVPPGDRDAWSHALERVYHLSARECSEVGRAAQRIAYERFAPSVYVKRVEEVYASLLRKAPSAAWSHGSRGAEVT